MGNESFHSSRESLACACCNEQPSKTNPTRPPVRAFVAETEKVRHNVPCDGGGCHHGHRCLVVEISAGGRAFTSRQNPDHRHTNNDGCACGQTGIFRSSWAGGSGPMAVTSSKSRAWTMPANWPRRI